MGIDDGQPENMFEFTNQFGTLTILDLDVDAGGDDDNASDADFKMDKDYQKEYEEQLLEDVEYLKNVDTETPEENLTLENQLDHFQLPPEVHNQQNYITDE